MSNHLGPNGYPLEKHTPNGAIPTDQDSASQNEAPPTYAHEDPITTEQISSLTTAFTSLNLSHIPVPFPTPDTCLAHLKLLSAFHLLKREVGYTDGLFGIWDARAEKAGVSRNSGSGSQQHEGAEALAAIREKRWSIFVARAAERFESWWVNVLVPREKGVRLRAQEIDPHNPEFRAFTHIGVVQDWTVEMLPPLDVLMVWHAFMLNPRNYLEDCVRFGLKDLWATGMPWVVVNKAIDASFNYAVSDAGMAQFVAATGYNWNNLEDALSKTLQCPRCPQVHEIPWTTLSLNEKSWVEDITTLDGEGYGDRGFIYPCKRCGSLINHELLRVAKFKKDAENLILNDWPFGGTILSPTGELAHLDAAVTSKVLESGSFPNRLVQVELRSQVLTLVNDHPNPTVNDIKQLIERAVKSSATVRKVNNSSRITSGLPGRFEKIAIRQMMSRYWDNSSIFALELGGAVIRQSIFVGKMYSLDWLHSPSASETMKRLIVKYSRFVDIMAAWRLHVAIPTLDVDLGWHTHQLSPREYFYYTVEKCKQFVDHDDKISEDKLSTAFEWTSQMYQKTYKEIYSACTCWYCEAIRTKHDTSIFGTSKQEKLNDEFYASGAASLCPPDNSAHISSHNAVHLLDTGTRAQVLDRLRKRHQYELDKAYDKACKRALAKGRKKPERNRTYTDTWGHSYLMYAPFMVIPVVGGGMYFAGDTCSMPGGAGMAGACAAGTCSGGAGAGACAGGSSIGGGDAGSSGGGCGGGGGGCGGGGGGGCGGGGS